MKTFFEVLHKTKTNHLMTYTPETIITIKKNLTTNARVKEFLVLVRGL